MVSAKGNHGQAGPTGTSHHTLWNKACSTWVGNESVQPDRLSWGDGCYRHIKLVAPLRLWWVLEWTNCFPWRLEVLGPKMAILSLCQLPHCPASLCDHTINDHYRRYLRMSFFFAILQTKFLIMSLHVSKSFRVLDPVPLKLWMIQPVFEDGLSLSYPSKHPSMTFYIRSQ